MLNPLPKDKIWDWSKLKVFAVGMVENIVGKGENAGYQHFLLFPQCFQKATFSGLLKVGIVWLRVNVVLNIISVISRKSMASAAIHAFLEFLLLILCTIFFPSHWLFCHTTFAELETAVMNERGMNPFD